MKVELHKWEVERIKEIIGDVLNLWNYDFVEANTADGRSMSMSKEEFLKQLEARLTNPNA